MGHAAAPGRQFVPDDLVLSFTCCPRLVKMGSIVLVDRFINGIRNFDFNHINRSS